MGSSSWDQLKEFLLLISYHVHYSTYRSWFYGFRDLLSSPPLNMGLSTPAMFRK